MIYKIVPDFLAIKLLLILNSNSSLTVKNVLDNDSNMNH